MELLQLLLTERNEKQLLIQRADSKASAIFVVMSIFFPTFISLMQEISEEKIKYILSAIFLLFFVAALILNIMVLLPREQRTGILYISGEKVSFDQYKEELVRIEENNIKNVLIEQNYILSNILKRKNRCLRCAFFLLLGFILVLTIIIAMVLVC